MSAAFALSLTREVDAASRARGAVSEHLSPRVPADTLADVLVVVSELVTNAIMHGEGAIELRIELDGPAIKGEVIDEGGGFEREMREEGVREIGGRGLSIVAEMTERWGVHEGTTHVWFEIPLGGASETTEKPQLGHPGDAQLPDV